MIAILASVALGGCGGAEREATQAAAAPLPKGDFGPVVPGHGTRSRPVAPPEKPPPAALAQALDGGIIGVVGVDGAIGVRPSSLYVSSDGTIEGIEWADWGSSAAKGSGRMRVLDCDPTCAGGGVEHIEVEIELSSPRLCGRATYFDRAVLTGGGVNPPTSYVRAPC